MLTLCDTLGQYEVSPLVFDRLVMYLSSTRQTYLPNLSHWYHTLSTMFSLITHIHTKLFLKFLKINISRL